MPGIVMHDERVVYWPMPKCACTSMKIVLARKVGIEFYNPHEAKFEWVDSTPEGYESFALVRHPASRLYSLWLNKIAADHPIDGEWGETTIDPHVFEGRAEFSDGMDFPSFVRAAMADPAPDPHWAPQAGQVPADATVIRMEDVRPLLRAVLPVRNASASQGWPDAYDGESRALAEAYYAEDLRRFGYE